jgi:predicted nucleic acid-binding protein
MRDNFLDTSALQHVYVNGPHSRRVRLLLGRHGSQSTIADSTVLEMASTLANRCRAKNLSVKTFDRLHNLFLSDIANEAFAIRSSGLREIRRAAHLIRFAGVVKKRGLKSADALIASCAVEHALEIQRTVNFYTSDWPLYVCLRDLNVFRTTMNLYLVGVTRDGTEPSCRVLRAANP